MTKLSDPVPASVILINGPSHHPTEPDTMDHLHLEGAFRAGGARVYSLGNGVCSIYHSDIRHAVEKAHKDGGRILVFFNGHTGSLKKEAYFRLENKKWHSEISQRAEAMSAIFSTIRRSLEFHKPVGVFVFGCYAGDAARSASNLPYGSTVVTTTDPWHMDDVSVLRTMLENLSRPVLRDDRYTAEDCLLDLLTASEPYFDARPVYGERHREPIFLSFELMWQRGKPLTDNEMGEAHFILRGRMSNDDLWKANAFLSCSLLKRPGWTIPRRRRAHMMALCHIRHMLNRKRFLG